MIDANETPDWVPDSVKSMALVTDIGGDVRKRLLADARMKAVWIEVKQACFAADKKDKSATSTALSAFDSIHHLSTWDIPDEGVSIHDQACAAFFSYAALELSFARSYWTRTQAKEFAKRWGEAAELCEWIAHDPMFDADFRKTAGDMIANFKKHEKLLREEGSLVNLGQLRAPYIIGGRGSGVRGDNQIRGRTRSLAMATRRLFGSYLYQSLATVITVGLDLKKPPKKDNIADCCADLPQ